MTYKRPVSVVITDLDNTLYDWVAMWGATFRTLLRGIVAKSGLPQEQLEAEIQAINQKYGTAEYSFLVQEIPSLQSLHPGADLAAFYRDAIKAAGRARAKALGLYPGVRDTLLTLKAQGVFVVAFTESRAFYTRRRIRRLRLDGVIDYLYSPPDHVVPAEIEAIRKHVKGYYELDKTVCVTLAEGEKKPDPEILLDILRETNADARACIYVGDSLMKDVAMAQDAGITDVWAKYGTAQHREEYELLRRVTHWSKEDVEREKAIARRPHVRPSFVLHKSFAQLFDAFTFESFGGSPKTLIAVDGSPTPRTDTANLVKAGLEAWKVTVEVQKHFNDLEMRIRAFALSFLGVVLGAAAVAMERAGGRSVLAIVLGGIGLLFWSGFYLMDRFWYHRLLTGSVNHGKAIEDGLNVVTTSQLFSLTKAIGDASPFSVFGRKLHSRHRLDVFYGLGALALVILLGVSWYLPPALPDDKPLRVMIVSEPVDDTPGSLERPDYRGSPSEEAQRH